MHKYRKYIHNKIHNSPLLAWWWRFIKNNLEVQAERSSIRKIPVETSFWYRNFYKSPDLQGRSRMCLAVFLFFYYYYPSSFRSDRVAYVILFLFPSFLQRTMSPSSSTWSCSMLSVRRYSDVEKKLPEKYNNTIYQNQTHEIIHWLHNRMESISIIDH